MPFILSLAGINLRMLPVEAIHAATINASHALELHQTHGKIQVGMPANFWISRKLQSIDAIPYFFGKNPVDKHFINGVLFE
jgi:imidazolonepropionase